MSESPINGRGTRKQQETAAVSDSDEVREQHEEQKSASFSTDFDNEGKNLVDEHD